MGNSKGECRFCRKIFSGRGIGKHLLACGAKKEQDETLNRGKNGGYVYRLFNADCEFTQNRRLWIFWSF